MSWPDTKICTVCRKIFPGKGHGIDVSKHWNTPTGTAFVCSLGCKNKVHLCVDNGQWMKGYK